MITASSTTFTVRCGDVPPGTHCGDPACSPCGEADRTGTWVDRGVSPEAAADAVRRLLDRGAATITIERSSDDQA